MASSTPSSGPVPHGKTLDPKDGRSGVERRGCCHLGPPLLGTGLPEDKVRALLYGSLALIAFALIATRQMWDEGGLAVLVWLALIGAGVYGCVTVYRTSREY